MSSKTPVFGGYTDDELLAAFELVKPLGGNWKMPIDATVPGDTDTSAVEAAVAYFTGGAASIIPVRPEPDEEPTAYRVTAPGYYACIGA